MPQPAIIDAALLDILLRAEEAITIQALALERGLTPERARREIDRLRMAGCRFDEHPRQGLRLLEAGLGTWTDYLESVLPGPRVIECYKRTASTQDLCRHLVEIHGLRADRAVAIADEQTAGRGRLGRRWTAPAGTAILFSAVVIDSTSLPDGQPDAYHQIDRLTFAVSVAVAQTMDDLLVGRAAVTIKWPNDVYADGRKIAGILVETCSVGDTGRAAIFGVGANVHLQPHQLPDELQGRTTSLAMCGLEIDRLRVLAQMLQAIDEAIAQPPADLLPRWRRRCEMMHQAVRLRSGGRLVEGEAIDLDPDLGLIVRTDSGALLHLPAATTTVV